MNSDVGMNNSIFGRHMYSKFFSSFLLLLGFIGVIGSVVEYVDVSC